MRLEELAGSVPFVNDKVCFDVDFVKYHAFSSVPSHRIVPLTPSRAKSLALSTAKIDSSVCLKPGWGVIGEHQAMEICDEHMHGPVKVRDYALPTYLSYLPNKAFPHEHHDEIFEVATDGHEKVNMKTACGCGGSVDKKHTSGWLMVVSPKMACILCVAPLRSRQRTPRSSDITRTVIALSAIATVHSRVVSIKMQCETATHVTQQGLLTTRSSRGRRKNRKRSTRSRKNKIW